MSSVAIIGFHIVDENPSKSLILKMPKIRENIYLNARDSVGKTQFMMACIGGHNEVVK